MRTLIFAVVAGVFCGCPPLDPCAAPGERSVTLTSSGLPAGVDGVLHVNGQTVTTSGTVTLTEGEVRLSDDPAVAPSTQLVRTAYLPTFTPDDACVAPDAGLPIEARWFTVPTSATLWALNSNGPATMLGFHTQSLAQGERAADVATQTDVGQFTFDQDGNVWAVRGTLASAALNFHASSDFISSGAHTPSRKIELAGLSSCLPNVGALAFDAAGDLWVASSCDDAVYKVTRASLATSATVTPTVKLTVGSPGGLAFDAAGNLFVASRDDGRVWRFDAAQLNADATAPAAKLGVRVSTDPSDPTRYSASWLAFDASGALWFNDFGANLFGSIPSASLGGTGELDVQPGVRITVGVAAVIENFAFDEQGGLWTAGAQGRLLRLGPDQLTASGMPVPERVIISSDIGSISGVAVYPAPAGLPLFHALP